MILAGSGAGLLFFTADAKARSEQLVKQEKPRRAVCVLKGSGVYGVAHFGQIGEKHPVEIRASFSGLTPGKIQNKNLFIITLASSVISTTHTSIIYYFN